MWLIANVMSHVLLALRRGDLAALGDFSVSIFFW